MMKNMALQLAPEEPEASPWHVELLSTVVNAVTKRRPDHGRPAVLAIDDIAWEHSRFGWADLLADGILTPLHHGQAVSYRPPRWDEHGREGALEVPAGCPLLIIEGDGAGRREVAHLIDTLIWVQADEREAARRMAARAADRPAADLANKAVDGAPFDEDGWMAEEIPFNTDQRTWERADTIVCGTPAIPCDPDTEVVIGRLALSEGTRRRARPVLGGRGRWPDEDADHPGDPARDFLVPRLFGPPTVRTPSRRNLSTERVSSRPNYQQDVAIPEGSER
jgi:hypothetical protein